MDKNGIKIIGLIVGLVVLIAGILFVTLKGIHLGPINAVSLSGIASKKGDVTSAKDDLDKAEAQYEVNMQSLEAAKKEFETQKEAYALISDETIAAIKEATKQEEYFIEYLWITLGNYATKHNLSLAVIEPGGSVSQNTQTTTTTTDNPTSVSTGTGVTGNSSSVNSTNNAATTGSPTSGTQQNSEQTEQTTTTTTNDTLTSNSNALTVQVKGSYINVADFVFEVENDKSLRFKLDNIKMKSAGGIEVVTSFNVKDFTVLKSLQ